MYNLAVDAELVAAARDGSQEAMDDLVGRSLPLVYNIVGRALSGPLDVDDVVQDTMLHVLRGLPGLRDPQAFRSWLVAVTMNQIRKYHRARPAASAALDEIAAVADPGADFVDLTLTQLGLTGQRRETVEATRWLDDDNRELLSLWWLVTTGHLTRTEMAAAIGLDPQLVSVQVNRMKAQLETGRLVVRALAAVPRCSELSQVIHTFDGRPTALWRKRTARHLRQCQYCGGLSQDLIAPERLLAGLALIPLPLGYTAYILAHSTHGAAAVIDAADVSASARPHTHRPTRGHRHRSGRSFVSLTSKPVLAAAAFTASVSAAMGITAFASQDSGNSHSLAAADSHNDAPDSARTSTNPTPQPTPTPTLSSATTSTVPTTPSSTLSPKPTHKPSSATTHSTASHPSTHATTPVSPTTPTPPTSAPTTPTTPPTTPTTQNTTTQSATPADQVLALINSARAAQGLRPYHLDAHMTTVADTHNRLMINGCGFSHYCAGEPDPCSRDAGPDGPGMWCGENIASLGPVGDSSENTLVALGKKMTQSLLAENPDKGHRYNLLSPVHVSIGISIIYDHGTVWMTQEFGD